MNVSTPSFVNVSWTDTAPDALTGLRQTACVADTTVAAVLVPTVPKVQLNVSEPVTKLVPTTVTRVPPGVGPTVGASAVNVGLSVPCQVVRLAEVLIRSNESTVRCVSERPDQVNAIVARSERVVTDGKRRCGACHQRRSDICTGSHVGSEFADQTVAIKEVAAQH